MGQCLPSPLGSRSPEVVQGSTGCWGSAEEISRVYYFVQVEFPCEKQDRLEVRAEPGGGEIHLSPAFASCTEVLGLRPYCRGLRGLSGTDIHADLSGISGAVVGTVRQITAAGKEEETAWLQYKPPLPLGQTATAAQWQRPALSWAALFCKGRTKVSQMVWQRHSQEIRRSQAN